MRATIVEVFHVISVYGFKLECWDTHSECSVEGLLVVCDKFELATQLLILCYTEWFSHQNTSLIPVSCRVFRRS